MSRRPDVIAARHAGPVTVTVLVVAFVALWLVARPSTEPLQPYVGQLVGAVAVLLMSIALVLISTLTWVEHWFDGIDRAAIWHRRLAILGTTLLALHIPLSSSPKHTALGGPLGLVSVLGLVGLALWAMLPRWRSVTPRRLISIVTWARGLPAVDLLHKVLGGYDRWRAVHRTTGLFVAAGFFHGLLDGSMFGSSLLRLSYVVVGGVGLAFYVYRELLSRFFRSLHDYQVEAVTEIEPGLVEIALEPIGRPVAFVPGQFALLYLEAKDGWHRHPFTIASTPTDRTLRVTVKALGDYTSQLTDLLEPGMPAVVGGPHGRFNHAKGTRRQLWIAGGVGVSPFLSWMRALDHHPVSGTVDFFYTFSGGSAPFGVELRDIADGQERVRVHLVDTRTDGRLTPEQVLHELDGTSPREVSVFLCGPEPMVRTFQTGLVEAGVRSSNIHREYFDWR